MHIRFTLIVLLMGVAITCGTAQAQLANPPNLAYSTYVGPASAPAQGNSFVTGLAVDSTGYTYVTGSYTQPCTFLTKLNQTGSAEVWSKCLGFANIRAVAVDASGYVYVEGDNVDAISVLDDALKISKLSSDGQQVIYSTAIAGLYASTTTPNPSSNLTVDAAGNLYVLGLANASFQTTPGAYLSSGGPPNAPSGLAKLSPTGAVQYATFLDLLSPYSVAVDSVGEVWAVGTICPPRGTFLIPTEFCNGNGTANAVRKLDAMGSHVLVSMGFGGGGISVATNVSQGYYDYAAAVAVDSAGAAWITGVTQSGTVPTTPNALQQSAPTIMSPQFGIGYALKLSASGSVLYGTFLGQTEAGFYAGAVAVDNQGRPYITVNSSALTGYPFTPAKILALSADGSTVLASTALPGTVAQFVSVDNHGGLYVAGRTTARSFLATLGSYQPFYPAGQYWDYEGLLAKFDLSTTASAAQFTSLGNVGCGSFDGYDGRGAVSPGEVVSLYGTNLPANPAVTFDGRAAPILYASSTQINTVVPFEVSAQGSAVSIQGVAGYGLPVFPAMPGLFTSNGSCPAGQLAALNQDGTVNSAVNPAKAGSIVSVFLTGAGGLTPSLGDGQLGPLQPPYPAPTMGSSATVTPSGTSTLVEAPLLFISQAPGLIAGVLQANIQIPQGTPSGTAKLVVYIGTYLTQAGNIAVR